MRNTSEKVNSFESKQYYGSKKITTYIAPLILSVVAWCDVSTTSSDDPRKIDGQLQTTQDQSNARLIFEHIDWKRCDYETETDRRWNFEINVDSLSDCVGSDFKDIVVRARVGENNLDGNIVGNPVAMFNIDSIGDELNINSASSVHMDLVHHWYDAYLWNYTDLSYQEKEQVRSIVTERMAATIYQDEYDYTDLDDFDHTDIYEYNQRISRVDNHFEDIIKNKLQFDQYILESWEVPASFRELINLSRFSMEESSWTRWIDITPHFDWSEIYYQINDSEFKNYSKYDIGEYELDQLKYEDRVITVYEVHEDGVWSAPIYIYYENWSFFIEYRWFQKEL